MHSIATDYIKSSISHFPYKFAFSTFFLLHPSPTNPREDETQILGPDGEKKRSFARSSRWGVGVNQPDMVSNL